MGFWKSVKDLFKEKPARDEGVYFYIKLDESGEIVQIRLNPSSEFNPNYKTGGFTCKKYLMGPRTMAKAETMFEFNAGREFVDSNIKGGSIVTREAWLEQEAGDQAEQS